MGVLITIDDDARRGGAQRGGVMAPTGERTSRTALLSLALGLLAVLATVLSMLSAMYMTGLPPWIGAVSIPAAIAAIVAGVLARRELRRDSTLGGYGLSLAGVVLGAVALLMQIVPMLLPMIFAVGFLVLR